MTVETIDLDFKLDDILEAKEDENNNNQFRPPLKKGNPSDYGESKKILKKIGHRKSEEEIKKTSELIIQISRFRDSSRFANFLTSLGFNLNPSHLKTLDIDELEDLLTELKCAIQNKNGSKVLDEGYFMALSMLENLTKHPKFQRYMDLNGLSANARQNDELLDTLETLNLMYADFGSMTPEKKLLFLTGGLIMRTSSVNKMLTNIKNYEESLKNQVENGSETQQNPQSAIQSSSRQERSEQNNQQNPQQNTVSSSVIDFDKKE